MSSKSFSLQVEQVGKCYHVYERPVDRLKQLLLPSLYRTFLRRSPKCYFTEFHALQNIYLSAVRGETIGIIGANGAGKSTLLQIISGTLTPSSGRVEVNGRVAALLELGSSFDPEFTGIENVYLYGAILGLDRKEMSRRLDAICRYADIGEYVYQPVKLYSSGMVMRLAFAVIVHVDADILIIDEALTVGDALFVQKCMRFLRDFRERGTVLFVSHDAATVLHLCSRVIWLEDGKIKCEGDPKRVSEAYLEAQVVATQNIPSTGMNRVGVEPDDSIGLCRTPADGRDMRLDFINRTTLRNDIELFRFSPDSLSFGQRKASIVNVTMGDKQGAALSWVVGGEDVVLCITCEVHEDIRDPIVGFYVKDRLGQYLFGDNTFLSCRDERLELKAGQVFQAYFRFRMPILPVGEYSIAPAIAVGVQDDHLTQHWFHDALLFKSHASSVVNSLVGIPMTDIWIQLSEGDGQG